MKEELLFKCKVTHKVKKTLNFISKMMNTELIISGATSWAMIVP